MTKKDIRRTLACAAGILLSIACFAASGSMAYAASKLPAPKNFSYSGEVQDEKAVHKLSWDKVSKASGYQVKIVMLGDDGKPSGDAIKKNTKKTTFETVSDPTVGLKIKVRAFTKSSGKKVYGKWAVIKTDPLQGSDPGDYPAVGGWTDNCEVAGFGVSEEDKRLVAEATATLAGASYEPVNLLATQVVAGTNYAYLCRTSKAVLNSSQTWSIVVVYKDLAGKAELLSAKDLTSGGLKTTDANPFAERLSGGWTMSVPSNGEIIPEHAKKALSNALKQYTGMDLSPVQLIATQVVAGTNMKILCRGQAVVPNAAPGWCVVTVYEDPQGKAEITGVDYLDFLYYVTR